MGHDQFCKGGLGGFQRLACLFISIRKIWFLGMSPIWNLVYGIWDFPPLSSALDYFLYPFWINLGISYSQGTFVWQRPQPVIFTPYSSLLRGPMV